MITPPKILLPESLGLFPTFARTLSSSHSLKALLDLPILCVLCLYIVCVLHLCVLGAHGSQRKASDPLEMELQMVVNYHVGTWNQNQILLQEQQAL